MTAVTLTSLSKRFGETVAVNDVSLTIASGELFFLLGPSGCGKTTLLRMIAGFIEPSAGSIHFGDRDVTTLPPNRRNTGMVFQSYALWPHMTVHDNVAYGLRVRKIATDQLAGRVSAALRMVHMEEYAQRKPNQLSGGQQQRVALARALVVQPTVLLLDEPLSNLDAKLRLEMRSEIRRICSETKITTIYVTHDQKEALSMADSVALMRNGAIAQVGPPRFLYQRPVSRFVADFLGETNFLAATVKGVSDDGRVIVETAAGELLSSATERATSPGTTVTCSIRPEAMRIVASPAPHRNTLSGKHLRTIYLGELAQHQIELKGQTIVRVFELNPKATASNDQVHIEIVPDDVIILND